MNRLKKWIYGFRSKAVPSCIGAVIFSAASLLIVATDYGERLSKAVTNIIYVCAAVSLAFAVWAVTLAVRHVPLKKRLQSAAQKTRFTSKFMADYSFRTVTITYGTLSMDIPLALMKAAAVWYFGSTWLMALAG